MKSRLLNIILLAFIAAALMSACKDDKNVPTEDEKDEINVFSKAEIQREALDTENGLQYLRLILRDHTPRTRDVSANSNYLQLLLVAPLEDGTIGKVEIVPGEYKLSSTEKEYSIYNSEDTRYEIVGYSKYSLNACEIKIQGEGTSIRLEGEAAWAGEESFEFLYEGTVEIADNVSFGGTFDSASVYYRSDYYRSETFNYILTLGSKSGYSIQFEIISPKGDYYNDISEGEYSYSPDSKSEMSIRSATFFSELDNAEIKVTDIQASISKTNNSQYVINGVAALDTLTAFSFQGELPIDRAYFKSKSGSVTILDHEHSFKSSHYYISTLNGTKGIPDEKLGMVVCYPNILFYDYYPMKSGTFKVGDDWLPGTLNNDVSNGDVGVIFTNSQGNGPIHAFVDGSVDIEITQIASYSIYKITGTVTTEVKYSVHTTPQDKIEPEGKRTIIELDYEGTLSEYEHFKIGPHSRLKGDTEVVPLTKAMADYSKYFWALEGADGVSANLFIALATENVALPAVNYDGAADDYVLGLDLNISLDAPWEDIPVGTYLPNYTWEYKPGTYNMGYEVGLLNVIWGTAYYNLTYNVYAPFGIREDDLGAITISREGDIYTITVDGYDDLGRNANRIYGGKYVGPIKVSYNSKWNKHPDEWEDKTMRNPNDTNPIKTR